MKVLDVGPGNEPFPLAQVVVEKYPDDDTHRAWRAEGRRRSFDPGEREVIVADVCALPFTDKSFDYVWCSAVLEHVEEPGKAVDELCRVGKSGALIVPHFASELASQIFYPDRATHHRWTCFRDPYILHFVECDTRDKQQTMGVLQSLSGGIPRGVLPLYQYLEIRMVWGPEAARANDRVLWEEIRKPKGEKPTNG